MQYLIFLLSSIGGLILNHFLTHPNSGINKKLPNLKFKAIQVSPCLKIGFKTKTVRVHHWMAYGLLLIITVTFSGSVFNNVVANGYFIGAIAQGLSFPDWKRIVDRK